MSNSIGGKKYIQVADQILKEIERGKWKEGDTIPTVRALAEKYHVSTQTANKATSHLVGIGILASKQGSGSVVMNKKIQQNETVVAMLIDRARSSFIRGVDDTVSYHGKDLYLSYLNSMAKNDYTPKLFVYDKNETLLSSEMKEALKNVSGILVQGTLPDCYISYLREIDVPLVFINRSIEAGDKGRFGSVLFDIIGLEQLSAYIASLGHVRILYAFSREFEMTDVYTLRYNKFREGFTAAVRDEDVEVKEYAFSPGEPSQAEKLKSLIEEGYSAVVCFNDITAIRVYDLLHQAQVRIPDEVSVCGYDDLFMAAMAVPPLTTVRVDRRLIVEEAMELLSIIQASDESVYLERMHHTELIIRRSCWQSK